MLEVRYKIWLDKDGKVFGKGPYCLLKGIKENGSLSKSAKCMGMSYNKAFNLIRDIEDRLGFKLLTSKSGGTRGGGSSLTEKAENLIEEYEKFFSECEQSIREIFDKHFKDKDL